MLLPYAVACSCFLPAFPLTFQASNPTKHDGGSNASSASNASGASNATERAGTGEDAGGAPAQASKTDSAAAYEFTFDLPAIGNGITPYWNAFGSALCGGHDLIVHDPLPHTGFDLFSNLPGVSRPMRVRKLSKLQRANCATIKAKNPKLICDYEAVRESPSYWPNLWADPLFGCKYPHEEAYAPWRAVCGPIRRETIAAKKHVLKALRAKYPDVADAVKRSAANPRAAAVHIRCDSQIIEEGLPQYGLLPHRYVESHLPRGVRHVHLMGVGKGGLRSADPGSRAGPSDKCGRAAGDLRDYLLEKRPGQGLTVSFGLELPPTAKLTAEEEALVDWLFMSSVPSAVGSLSSFALGALLGNPGHVLIPVSPNGTIKPPSSDLHTKDCRFVQVEFLSGSRLRDMPWPAIQTFLRNPQSEGAAL